MVPCLTLKAVHIEVAPKLDTDSCLNANKRFGARKSEPYTLISDNGKNFLELNENVQSKLSYGNKKGSKMI